MSRRLGAVLATGCLLLAGCQSGNGPAAGPTTQQTDAPSAAASSPSGPSSADASPQPRSCRELAGGLSLEEKVGQLFMVGTTSAGMGEVASLVPATKVGSVLLLGSEPRGLADTAQLAGELRTSSTTAGVPLLVATDQEGGQVQRLAGAGFDRIPSATEQGRMPTARLQESWTTWGRQLRQAGVLYDLAPVADVVRPGFDNDNAAIGALDRNYGTDAASVAGAASAVVNGLAGAGVASSVKHYPGLGAARANTDHGVATDATTTLEDADSFLQPMAQGASSVMVSSTIYTRIDPGTPAVFSRKVVTDGLRGRHGWQKVVISDDLGAAAAVSDVPVGERGVRFVRAGGDLVIDADPASLPTMVDGVLAAARTDPALAASLDEKVARVLALKAEVGLLECAAD